VWDEPLTDADLRAAGDLVALLDSLPGTRDQLALVTLLPVVASGQPAFDSIHGRDKVTAYRRYLDRVAAMYASHGLRPPLFCADHYPFQDGVMRTDYFLTLAGLRDAAARWGAPEGPVPFWVVVQLSPARLRGNRYRDTPTFAQVKWQVSNAIAYGAKGILYWTLAPSGPGEFGAGLIDRAGRTTAHYGPLRALHLELRRLGPVLMRLDPVAVRHQSAGGHEGIAGEVIGTPAAGDGLVRKITGGGGQAVAGHLRDRATGADYLYVVNRGLRAAADFTLELARHIVAVERVTGADTAPVRVASSGSRFTVRGLPPGSGALYRVRTRG
jgi:hypothetical protein